MTTVQDLMKCGAQIPPEGSERAEALIEAMLKEYNYPANPKNSARAGYRAARLAVADAVEAQAAEIERLKKYVRELEDAVTPELVQLRTERDALQSKLDAMQSVEPKVRTSSPLHTWRETTSAWWNCRSAWGVGGVGLSEAEAIKNWAQRNPKEVERLGLAASKVAEPLTADQISRIVKPYGAQSIYGFDHIKAFVRAIEAAHGITKGQP